MNRIVYYYDSDIGNYCYGPGHPMKPHRMRMANSLLYHYNLLDKLNIVDGAYPIESEKHFTYFHSEDYIDFLKTVTPDNLTDYSDLFVGYNMGEDCPVFDGLYDFCKLYTKGSLIGASYLNSSMCDIAVNWSGGLHHAKEREASGFCYINDCVLAILELLKVHHRVLYLDIDIHHGDGVEEAFYRTNRVLTCSFHKFGSYFPDTGYFTDSGYGLGDGYCVNFPLSEGMDDDNFLAIFKPVITEIFSLYDPQAVVMQCGADSLSGDRLGCFNLSTRGHGACVKFVKSFNVPMLVLGGGGYTLRNVARCWTYETSVLLDEEISESLPQEDEYLGYYAPDYKLHPPISNMENTNSKEYLQMGLETVLTNLREKVTAVSPQISNYKENPLYNTVNPNFSPDKYTTIEVE